MLEGKKIILGVCGGIAAYKSCYIVSHLIKEKCAVRVVMTEEATKLVGPLSFQALSGEKVISGSDSTSDIGMSHIELSRWADLLAIIPCTANMMGKIANGIADDFLSTVSLAFRAKQVLVPAMNPEMWNKKSVQRNLQLLKGDGFTVMPPEEGLMACGDVGEGRLPEENEIIKLIEKLVS